jgi:D-3-phosphoglycerate dehydrogenase
MSAVTQWQILASDGLHKNAAIEASKKTFLNLRIEKNISAPELPKLLNETDFLIVRSATQVDSKLIECAPKLKGVIRAGVGVDNIDLQACAQKGIWAWNAPTGNYQSAAEHALALLFALSRKIVPAANASQQSKWIKKEIGESGRQLSGLTLGLFGAGQIGSRVAKMATGIGMKVQICDPFFTKSSDKPFEKVDFQNLLTTSDVISIHTPLTAETKNIFNLSAFEKMKPTAMLINAARGAIVNEKDLITALDKNYLEGAALDVFEKEPFSSESAALLLSNPKIIATPHLGASTREAQLLVGLECIEILEKVFHAHTEKKPSLWPKPLNNVTSPRLSYL